MPELPEVEALAEHLRTHALARPVARVDLETAAVTQRVVRRVDGVGLGSVAKLATEDPDLRVRLTAEAVLLGQ